MTFSFKTRFLIPQCALSAALLCCVLAGTALAEEIRLSATVDKNQLTLEDTVELSLTVHGANNPPVPNLPPLPNFRVRSAGTLSSTQIINSDVRVSTTLRYLLIPKSAGLLVIGPATIELSGKTYKSDSITLTVEKSRPGRTDPGKPAFVETAISNKKPFVNEQVLYTFKLYQRVEARNLNLDMPYDDTLFRKEDLGKAKRYSQVLNGISYDVHELSVALFPLKTGKAVIPPTILEMDLVVRQPGKRRNDPFSRFFNDPFFGRAARTERKVLTSPQLKLDVQPLPETGRLPDFQNLVGQFSIRSELGKTDLEAGDTTTLTVTISGTGNIMDAALPEPDLQGQFKVYPDQPEFKQAVYGNRIGGEKIFKFALIPYSEGRKTVPALTLSFFDPEKKTHVTARTRSLDLNVRPGKTDETLNLVESDSAFPREGRTSVKILARDILPIHTQLSDFGDMGLTSGQQAIYAAGMLVPVAVYFIAAGYINYHLRMKYDPAYLRSQGAYNAARRKLDRLSASSGTDPKTFVKELSQIVREYIGNKLNLQGTAFTSAEVETKLKEKAIEEEQTASLRNLLEKCESLQYAPVTGDGGSELIGESLDLIKQLEKQI